MNTFQLDYDFTRRIGARLGYRYGQRRITFRESETESLHFFPTLPNRGRCAGRPLNPDGSCRTTISEGHADMVTINEHSALFGIWMRPVDQVRISFDLELLSADNTFTALARGSPSTTRPASRGNR